MKIGLLTRRAGFNHGSSLQAYALLRVLESLGNDVSIINYDEFSQHFTWRIRPFIEDILTKLPFKKFVLSKGKSSYLSKRKCQYRRFYDFEDCYIRGEGRRIRTKAGLSNFCKNFDAVVCGSDQIWHPSLFDSHFILDFVPDKSKTKKIAYAPSLGINDIKYLGEKEKALIKRIDYLSCREDIGSKIIEKFTGREVKTVLDPTLLLDSSDWDKIKSKRELYTTPYILCYFLGKDIPINYIEKLKKLTKLRVLDISMFNRSHQKFADEECMDIGPEDFLKLISQAEYVCTDSFHATVFSVIFERRISLFERFKTNDISNQNSRIYNLCDYLNISQIIMDENSDPNIEIPNYREAKNRLNDLKRQSIDFLKNALSH